MALARLELVSGRDVELARIHMTSTYGGVLEGYPCAPVNNMILNGLPAEAGRWFPNTPVHLITPPVAALDHGEGRWPFGPPEALPPVICTGLFTSTPIGAGSRMDLSSLVVVWFQNDPTVPTGHDAPLGLREVRWEDLAEDSAY